MVGLATALRVAATLGLVHRAGQAGATAARLAEDTGTGADAAPSARPPRDRRDLRVGRRHVPRIGRRGGGSDVARVRPRQGRPLGAQGRAPDLARVVAERGVDALDRAGDLERFQARADVGEELLVGQVGAELDQGVRHRPELLVRQPDHAGGAHGRCSSSAASTSAGYTFSPPTRIMSVSGR